MTKQLLPVKAHCIPAGAKRVFQGEIFSVYQWPQKLFDGSMATFEMLRRPDTVIIIAIDEHNQLITINEQQPDGIERTNYFPSGRVDVTDESTLAAAKRELQEETGYSMANWKLVNMRQPEKKIEWFVSVFIATGVSKKGQPHHDAGEKIIVELADFSRVMKQLAGLLPVTIHSLTELRQVRPYTDYMVR